jgi:hypothetical protein
MGNLFYEANLISSKILKIPKYILSISEIYEIKIEITNILDTKFQF